MLRLSDDIKKVFKKLPSSPGIYKFLNAKKGVIYIGKAKNLNKRIRSYFTKSTSKKITNLTNESNYLELTLTSSELEALLLEQHLIKVFKPKFNIQFKDDKGYPWIRVGLSKDYPFAKSFLGKKESKDLYLGPYPTSLSIKETLRTIQKIFKIRDCSESVFKNRSRPCLQYEIGRCSAPCVKKISKKDYQEDVYSSIKLLQGEGDYLVKDLYKKMDKFSELKEYEKALLFRDKISYLREVQRDQSIAGYSADRDAVVLCSSNTKTRIGVTKVRGGWITSHQNFKKDRKLINDNTIEAFISSYYFEKDNCPATLLVDRKIKEKEALQSVLSEFHGKKIRIINQLRKKDQGLLEISKSNTSFALRRNDNKKDLTDIFDSLTKILGLNKTISFIESYDVSHLSGKNAVGGCVVFNSEGKVKSMYRTYNISKKYSGNDLGSMREMVRRRFKKNNLDVIPDLIIIDGGKNHLLEFRKELDNLNIKGINLFSISKGVRRKREWDKIHSEFGKAYTIERNSEEYRFLQELRDESHRFVISRQRNKELRTIRKSSLDSIKSVGTKRKKALLRYFGSSDQIDKASPKDLMKVKGVGKKTADIIFRNLH